MRTEADLHRLRIFINESDRLDGKPLYEAIVRAARDEGLAGATALRGIEGFGANNRVHTVKILRLSEDLPIVVEVVDRPERIADFMPVLERMVAEGMVTIEKVHTITLRRENGTQSPAEEDELQLESSELTPAVPSAAVAAAPAFEQVTPITDAAQHVLEAARGAAVESRRVFADSVDVLVALLCESEGIATRALKSLGIDCQHVHQSLGDQVSRDEPTKSFLSRVVKRSNNAARWLGDEQVGTQHLLLALCEIRPSTATDVLMRLGALPRDICGEVFKLEGHEDDWQRWMADHPEM
jgi:PII-like signaling protein